MEIDNLYCITHECTVTYLWEVGIGCLIAYCHPPDVPAIPVEDLVEPTPVELQQSDLNALELARDAIALGLDSNMPMPL